MTALKFLTPSDFGPWVRDEREKVGVSQREVCRRAGLSHATLTDVGQKTVTLSTVLAVCHALGFDLVVTEKSPVA
jgi:hypothetical protein